MNRTGPQDDIKIIDYKTRKDIRGEVRVSSNRE